jgi:peptide/nickel transport system substrate-binding protein
VKKIIETLRPTERLIFVVCSILFILSSIYILDTLNKKYSTEVPVSGGSYTEGIVGFSRFINPVLAYTDADKDMTSLVYSGLVKPSSQGEITSDLAESWSISEDGLIYTFILKSDLYFHDGTPLTTDDIEFTIEKMRNPVIKSPKIDIWNGVRVERVSEKEIRFILKKAYAPFLENLTFGVLPKHLWKNIDNQVFDVHVLNREPIGSGPYMIKKFIKDSDGIYEYYDLQPFKKYSLGSPYIKQLRIRFYKNEQDAIKAYIDGRINSIGGISTDSATMLSGLGKYIIESPLPRIFALFLNQNEAPVLLNKEVRQALNVSINRNLLIEKVLGGWGTSETGPIPSAVGNKIGIYADNNTSSSTTEDFISAGRSILEQRGWKIGEDGVMVKEVKNGTKVDTQRLSFSISTSNASELKTTAEFLKEIWTNIGADVTIEVFEPSDLTQKVIRSRKYQSLLFGNVIGRDLDLYPFWHSSERNDPGLNISLYTNAKVDRALEAQRSTSEESKRIESRQIFQTEIQNDIPAIFLYSPNYIYVTDEKVKNLRIGHMTSVSERFSNIHTWYIETERVWNIFLK